jgi:hypothetical protein
VSQTVPAVAQLILLVYIIAASGTDEIAPSLRVIDIYPVAACPALVHPDVGMTVINHMAKTAFVAYHEVPPFRLLSRVGRIQIADQDPSGIPLHSSAINKLYS